MRTRWITPAVLGAFLLGMGRAQTPSPEAFADRVRQVLSFRCVECHGAKLERPKGRFGGVEDLGQVVAKYVVPGNLDESPLWWHLMGEQDLMPPKKAANGPMTVDEWALIKWWIEQGAPAPAAAASEVPRNPQPSTEGWTLGPFHVVLVHFPVALVWAALLAELLAMMGVARLAPAARFCLVLTSLSGVLAGVTGWAMGEIRRGPEVTMHRWWAVAGLGLAVLASFLGLMATRRGGGWRWVYRVLLLSAALVTGFAGHLGGILVHGPNHLPF